MSRPQSPTKISDVISETLGTSSSGESSFTRVMRFHVPSADPVDLITAKLLPQIGSAHPNHSKFIARAIGKSEWEGDDVYRVNITYRYTANNLKLTMGRGGSGVHEFSEETPPWELPPQNVRESHIDMEIPMLKWFVYDEDSGKYEEKEFQNTAGQKMLGKTTVQVQVIEFDINHKKEVSKSKMARKNVINSRSETVLGYEIEKHQGKLLPMARNHYIVYASDTTGAKKWEYDTVHIAVHILRTEDGWMDSYLNVGNMVLWKKGDDKEKTTLGGVFRYNKLVNKDDTILNTDIVHGDIGSVIEQRRIYIKNGGKPENFNYEQLDGPFPLDDDGCLDLAALQSGEYKKLKGFPTKPESWAQYDLPKELVDE